MISNTIANNIFTGAVSTTVNVSSYKEVSNILSNNLTVLNTPIVGTTIIGKPGKVSIPGRVLFNTCYDSSGNPIQLTTNDNAFFQGLTFFSNLYPGGSWVGLFEIFIGASQLDPTSLSPTFNNGDRSCYPLSFAKNPMTTPQVVQYYPTVASQLPAAFVPNGFTVPKVSSLNKFSSAVDTKNYLTVGYSLDDGITLNPTYTGDFTVYACYMTIVS